MVRKDDEMTKAFWHDKEIYEIDFHSHSGWVEIIFKVNGYESPITGTGRRRVWMEDIVLEEAHD